MTHFSVALIQPTAEPVSLFGLSHEVVELCLLLIVLLLSGLLIRRRSRKAERVQADSQTIRDTVHFVDQIVDMTPDLVYIYNLPERRNIYTNRSIGPTLGYTPEELVQMGPLMMTILLHPDDQAVIAERNRQYALAKDGEVIASQYRMRHRDGRYRWLYSQAVVFRRDAEGNPIDVLGNATDITELKETQANLSTLRNQLQTILDSASESAIIVADEKDTITVFSSGAERMLGYTAAEVVGKAKPKLFHLQSEIAARIELAEQANHVSIRRDHPLVDLTRLNVPEYREWTFIRKDGKRILVDLAVTPIEDENKREIGYLGISTDITRRKQTEAIAREQQVLAEALRDTVVALTSTLDLDAVLTRILDTIETVVPHDTASIQVIENGQLRILHWRHFQDRNNYDLPTATLPASLPRFVAMQTDPRPNLVSDTNDEPSWMRIPGFDWIRSHIGAPIQVRGKLFGFLNVDSSIPNFYTDQLAERLVIFARQAAIAIENAQLYSEAQQRAAELEKRVTERTTELTSQQTQLVTILDSLGEGVFYVEGRTIRYANRALCDLTGFTLEELLRPRGLQYLAESSGWSLDEISMRLNRSARPDQAWHGELKMKHKDGQAYLAAVTISLLHAAHQRLDGAVVVIRDVTQEKQLEELKATFIANASHELRTPLTSLKTRLYLIKRQPDSQAEHLAAIERASNRMEHLVEDLLDVSRFERGVITLKQQEIVLQTLINEAVQAHQIDAKTSSITLQVDLPDLPIRIQADSSRLMQVIVNLLVNAIHYTPAGGKVCIQLRETILSVDGGGARRCAVLQVIDTGIGIAPEHLSRIFEPFYRVNDVTTRGTGLGLSISRSIIELHRGTLTVESKLGQGSAFSVTLPIPP